jgi:hypothetical protein
MVNSMAISTPNLAVAPDFTAMSNSNPPSNEGPKQHPRDDISVIIQSTRGTKPFDFPKTAKISDVIDQAVVAFGFVKGDKFSLALASDPGTALDPNRPLVSYHIVDGTQLILSATGGGV